MGTGLYSVLSGLRKVAVRECEGRRTSLGDIERQVSVALGPTDERLLLLGTVRVPAAENASIGVQATSFHERSDSLLRQLLNTRKELIDLT